MVDPVGNVIRFLGVVFCAALSVCLLAGQALAQEARPLKGVALVVGQSAYQSLQPLSNPAADARAIEGLLARLGFTTTLVLDQTAKKSRRAVDNFIDDAEGADVALLYYSGHAIEAGGNNYLIPTDATPAALETADQSFISLQDTLDRLRGKARIVILLFDACRTNPFPQSAVLKREAGAPALAVSASGLGAPRGVTVIEPSASGDSVGEVIGFAAEPGRVALDGPAGTNSPYAKALIKHLSASQGYDFSQVMTMVTEEVYLATGTRQRPWTNASLRRFLSFGGSAQDATADAALITGERRKLLLTIAATPRETRAFIEVLAKDRSLPLDPLYGLLKDLKVDVSAGQDKLDEQLREGAENLKQLLAEKIAPVRKDPELVRLAQLADEAQREGLIALARDYRAKASTRADELDEALDGRDAEVRIELASAYADEAGTALLALDYRRASEKYAQAYKQVVGREAKLAFHYMMAEANALADEGEIRGDTETLKKAFSLYSAAVVIAEREKNEEYLAKAHLNTGNVLRSLGERENDTASFRKALASYEAAFKVWTREGAPLDWALTQRNLGDVLLRLGERENTPDSLDKAVAAYELALPALKTDDTRLEWAKTQNNLAIAYARLAERETGSDSLLKAAAAFEAALTVTTRARDPLGWAAARNNLGNILQQVGERQNDPGSFAKAVAAFEAALQERTRERAPLQWAATQNNLGNVLTSLGKRESGTSSLEKAVAAYELALSERTRERTPLDWAVTRNVLGEAQLLLGSRRRDRAMVMNGRTAVADAWEFYKTSGMAHYEDYFVRRLVQFDETLATLAP